jgi:hypothetical protein
MAKKEQAVNLQYFEKKAQNANRKEKFYLDEEEVEFIQYHPVFSKSKRTALIQEFLETARYCGENNIDYFKNYGQEMEYLEFLVVKYFTDVKDMLTDVDVEGHLAVKDTLVESSFTEIMINEVFHIDEISKVFNDYNIAISRLGKVNKELETKAKLLQQAQNAQKLQEKKIKAVNK